jgi:hypothetical protein
MDISELSNHQIVALSIARLGGSVRKIDTEDVAVLAFDLAPKRFCWKKYPDKIDLIIIRNALSNASKPRNGQLIKGGFGGGWMLSKKGVTWLATLPNDLLFGHSSLDNPRESLANPFDSERQKLRQSRAVNKFRLGESDAISLSELYEFVRVNEYFPLRKRLERFAVIENAVAEDEELLKVWEFLKRRFKQEVELHGS